MRRVIVLRMLANAKDRKRPTRMVEWALRVDKRVALDRLRRIGAFDRAPRSARIDPALSRRLIHYEDHLTSSVRLSAEPGSLVDQLGGTRLLPEGQAAPLDPLDVDA